jgi:hypothetical protein
MAGSCECGNETSVSIKCGEISETSTGIRAAGVLLFVLTSSAQVQTNRKGKGRQRGEVVTSLCPQYHGARRRFVVGATSQ